jgi:hypothetical protein
LHFHWHLSLTNTMGISGSLVTFTGSGEKLGGYAPCYILPEHHSIHYLGKEQRCRSIVGLMGAFSEVYLTMTFHLGTFDMYLEAWIHGIHHHLLHY